MTQPTTAEMVKELDEKFKGFAEMFSKFCENMHHPMGVFIGSFYSPDESLINKDQGIEIYIQLSNGQSHDGVPFSVYSLDFHFSGNQGLVREFARRRYSNRVETEKRRENVLVPVVSLVHKAHDYFITKGGEL